VDHGRRTGERAQAEHRAGRNVRPCGTVG
jgi:hypothetical protein